MADGAAAITSEIWVTEVIDNRPDAGVDCSLALNGAGEPHALYWLDQESPAAKLIFAKRAKPEWLRETLPAKRGARTALIFDDQRQPWVAYYDLDAARINVGFTGCDGARQRKKPADGVQRRGHLAPHQRCLSAHRNPVFV